MADQNGRTVTWMIRVALAAFITWAVADRVAVGNRLQDYGERIVRLEERSGIQGREQ